MKFVALQSVKGLKVNDQVYTLDSEGKYGAGKLLSRTENSNGTTWAFETPQYFNESAPMIKPVTVTNVTHVASMKDKSVADEAGSPE